MRIFVGKFIVAVFRSEMFLVSQVYQAIVPIPAIRMNNALTLYTAMNNCLKCHLRAVRHDFGVYTPIALEQTKNNGFSPDSSSPYAFDPTRPKIAFIYFNLAAYWRFRLTVVGAPFPDGRQVTVDGISV